MQRSSSQHSRPDQGHLQFFERLAWKLHSGNDVSSTDVEFSRSYLPLFDPPTGGVSAAWSVLEYASVCFSQDSSFWLVPIFPGQSVACHLLKSQLIADAPVEAISHSRQLCLLVLLRNGRRPGRYVVPSISGDGDVWLCRQAFVLERRLRHRPIADRMSHLGFCAAIASEGENRKSLLVDRLTKALPADTFDEVSEVLFGSIWDLAKSLETPESLLVTPGMYNHPDVAPTRLRIYLSLLQELAIVCCAPYSANVDYLRLFVANVSRSSEITTEAKQKILDASEALLFALPLWQQLYIDLLTSHVTQTGLATTGQAASLSKVMRGQNVRLVGWKRIAASLMSLGCGTAAANICSVSEPEIQKIVALRRYYGARIVGQLSIKEAAKLAGLPVSSAPQISTSGRSERAKSLLADLASAFEQRGLPLTVWRERWRRGEIPISAFDEVRRTKSRLRRRNGRQL